MFTLRLIRTMVVIIHSCKTSLRFLLHFKYIPLQCCDVVYNTGNIVIKQLYWFIKLREIA